MDVNDRYLNSLNCPDIDSNILGLLPVDSTYVQKEIDILKAQVYKYVFNELFRLNKQLAKEEALRGQTQQAYDYAKDINKYHYLIDYLTLMYLKAQEYIILFDASEDTLNKLKEEFKYDNIKKCLTCSTGIKLNIDKIYDIFAIDGLFIGGVNFMTILEDVDDYNPFTINS